MSKEKAKEINKMFFRNFAGLVTVTD